MPPCIGAIMPKLPATKVKIDAEKFKTEVSFNIIKPIYVDAKYKNQIINV